MPSHSVKAFPSLGGVCGESGAEGVMQRWRQCRGRGAGAAAGAYWFLPASCTTHTQPLAVAISSRADLPRLKGKTPAPSTTAPATRTNTADRLLKCRQQATRTARAAKRKASAPLPGTLYAGVGF